MQEEYLGRDGRLSSRAEAFVKISGCMQAVQYAGLGVEALNEFLPQRRGERRMNMCLKEGLIYSFTSLSRLRGERSEGGEAGWGRG